MPSRVFNWVAAVIAIWLFADRDPWAQRQSQQPGPFIVAVAMGNTLLPVARYNGSRWANTWPPPADRDTPVPALNEIPTAWLAQRVPIGWTVWESDGRQMNVRVTGTIRDPGCSSAVKLTFDGVHVENGVALSTARRVAPVLGLDHAGHSAAW